MGDMSTHSEIGDRVVHDRTGMTGRIHERLPGNRYIVKLDQGEQISKWPEPFQRQMIQDQFLTPPADFTGLRRVEEIESSEAVTTASRVRLCDIVSRPLLNGLEGVLGARLRNGRWPVSIDRMQEMSDEAREICEQLKPEYQASFRDVNFSYVQASDVLPVEHESQVSFAHDILPLVVNHSIFEDRDVLRLACTSKSAKRNLEGCRVHLEGDTDPTNVELDGMEDLSLEVYETPLPHSTRTLKAQVASVKLNTLRFEPPHKNVFERCSESIRNIHIEDFDVQFIVVDFQPNFEQIGYHGSLQHLREPYSEIVGMFVASFKLMPHVENLFIGQLAIQEILQENEVLPLHVRHLPPYDLSNAIPDCIKEVVIYQSAVVTLLFPFISNSLLEVNRFQNLHTLRLGHMKLEFTHPWILPPNLKTLSLDGVKVACEEMQWPLNLENLTLERIEFPGLTRALSSLPETVKTLYLAKVACEGVQWPPRLEDLTLERIEFPALTIAISSLPKTVKKLNLEKVDGPDQFVLHDGLEQCDLYAVRNTSELVLPPSMKDLCVLRMPSLMRIELANQNVPLTQTSEGASFDICVGNRVVLSTELPWTRGSDDEDDDSYYSDSSSNPFHSDFDGSLTDFYLPHPDSDSEEDSN